MEIVKGVGGSVQECCWFHLFLTALYLVLLLLVLQFQCKSNATTTRTLGDGLHFTRIHINSSNTETVGIVCVISSCSHALSALASDKERGLSFREIAFAVPLFRLWLLSYLSYSEQSACILRRIVLFREKERFFLSHTTHTFLNPSLSLSMKTLNNAVLQ